MKIAFIPIDNRPVCYSLAEQIADIDKEIELFLPNRELLGDLKKNADIDGILNWFENIEEVDCVVASLDTIAYGGLIPSRRSKDSFETIKKRIEKFKNILASKKADLYAFSSIMRISNNNVNEEEKDYWNLYGEKIFKYSYESHKNAPGMYTCEDVPQEILQDYLSTRKRNFDINKLYLEWAKEGLFKTLVFSKDDCAKYGLNVAEAQSLQNYIKDYEITTALIKTGADEIPLSLLSRAVCSRHKKIKILPIFTEPDYIDRISKYEDISVFESVKGQIELAGAEFCEDERDSDIVLVVNNFKNEQGELVMGVDTEEFQGELNFPQKPFLIADIRNANGSDNNFVKQFFEHKINIEKFLGYAGWNTTGNTLGSALCCAIVKYFARVPDLKAFKKVQTVRLLDDWAYQANVRKKLKSYLKEISLDSLKKEMAPYETIVENFLEINYESIRYLHTWNRFFEIEILID